jgi:hypothetical protein
MVSCTVCRIRPAGVRCSAVVQRRAQDPAFYLCRSPKPGHKQYVGRGPPNYTPPALRAPPMLPPSFPMPPDSAAVADSNPFARRLPFPSKTASGIYHVPVRVLPR